ncbi:hypothetical protein CRG98_030880 [Punica granatum]|uniref:ABC-2 type transporter transmembrane domain-containing protein n=1 Tax=Punica granatum TaxID=22663 RepID=A0A2I0IXJ5_PUNGR|nr:hypothetical protein CRG98_030880 [Punica granatum]
MAVEGMMMVIASIVPNFLMGIIAATGVQGLMILGAGIYRLPKDIPKPFWKYPIYYIALHRYAYQGLCKNEFEGLEISDPTRWHRATHGRRQADSTRLLPD